MSTTIVSAKHITALLLSVALCVAFFTTNLSIVQAEEIESTTANEEVTDTQKRAAMVKQIESLQAVIARHQLKTKTEATQVPKEVKVEKKAERTVDQTAFMAGLAGLDEAEKRTAMLEFIEDIRAIITARQATQGELVQEKKIDQSETKKERTIKPVEPKTNVGRLSNTERIADIMEQVAVIREQMEVKRPEVKKVTLPAQDKEKEKVTRDNYSQSIAAATIRLIEAKAARPGELYANETAYLSGTGLEGELTIKFGNIEPRFVKVTSASDTSVEFTVPSYRGTIQTSVRVINQSGKESGHYSVTVIAANIKDRKKDDNVYDDDEYIADTSR